MATNGGSVQEEKINTDIVTLTRFLTEEQAKHKEATGDFTYAKTTSLSLADILTRIQTSLPCLTILLQVDSLLHPPIDSHQPYWPRRLEQHNRR